MCRIVMSGPKAVPPSIRAPIRIQGLGWTLPWATGARGRRAAGLGRPSARAVRAAASHALEQVQQGGGQQPVRALGVQVVSAPDLNQVAEQREHRAEAELELVVRGE